jgi:pyridoxal phosphate enzyme (YggS family)
MTTDRIIEASERLATLRDGIDRAARLTQRTADDIKLIAVSKTQDADAIRPLLHAGQRRFGENRVQEAQEKWPALREEFSGVELHLVGQLQSNKAADAVALFDVIHSLDRPSLLTALAKAMDGAGKRVPCFIQVNIGAEEQKGGCAIADLPALIAAARDADIPVAGLMCVPPADIEAAPFFALLVKIAREEGLDRLSMGMSGDYETAIMLGATDIRVGTALFGERPSPARPVPASGRGMLRNSRAK